MENPEPLEDILREVLESRVGEIHTAIPGRVETYYSADQTADVQPLIKAVHINEDGDPQAESYPILQRVPVIHPRGGGFFVHFPIAKGDFVMLVFQEAAIDQWRAKGGRESHPSDLRKHALGNAVAYPGLYPTSKKLASAHATNLVIGSESGPEIHVQPGGQIRLGSAGETSLVALADLVATELTRIKSDITTLKSATHAVAGAVDGVVPGTSTAFTAATSAVPSNPSSTAATKVTAL